MTDTTSTDPAEETRVRIDDPRDFPPPEDGYERLWTPQRMTYVLRNTTGHHMTPHECLEHGTGKDATNTNTGADDGHHKPCPFCQAPRKSDPDGLIAWRGRLVFAIMNLYPYNCGHLMICPYRHVSLLTDLTPDEMIEFEQASALAMEVMADVSHPDGWNLGINQGDVAGAGVATHLHQHIVPRWNGDSNFMPIVAGTRTMPILLENQRAAYASSFTRLAPARGLTTGEPAPNAA